MAQDKPSSSTSPGGRLRAALTGDQIQILLDVVAATGHWRAVDQQLRAADPDLADTVQRILGEAGPPSEALPSSHKILEIWSGLWAIWEDHVSRVGEEEGPYVNQDEHWHPPYFDQSALAADLEKAADQLSGWIIPAFPLVGEPDLFLESLAEISDNMQLFPDWFQPTDDNFILGPHASSCVLRWTWLGLVDQPESGRELVDVLCRLGTAGQHAGLDRNTCYQFIAGLPEDACRQIHAYLRAPQFAERVANLWSVWHLIQHEFESRFDPSAHLRSCEEHLKQDWHYGEPLLADAVSRQDFAAAERFVELTVSRLLRCSEEGPWRPEERLLPDSHSYRPTEESQALLGLLDQWEDFASRCEKPERVASLRLQRTVRASPEDWTTVLKAFEEYRHRVLNPAGAERLYAEWRERMITACIPPESRSKHMTDTWTYHLIEAQRDPASNASAFIEHVEVWLECCQQHAAFFEKNWRSLALLTRHLPQYQEIRAAWATFHSDVLIPALQVSDEMSQSLRQALLLLGQRAKQINVRPVWEQHLHVLVPSPGSSGSYHESAAWMRALSEVKPAAYEKLLARWKVEFKRRRNLWKEMAAANCPGL